MASSASVKRLKLLVPALLIALVGSLLFAIFTATPRTPPAMLGASAQLDGGLARIHGVIPVESDGWTPPASAPLPAATDDELHRVRILVELTALEPGGMKFDPSQYAVSSLGAATWKPVWFSPAPAMARQGESISATLVYELPDRAIELTLELPGGPGLALGAGHHRGG